MTDKTKSFAGVFESRIVKDGDVVDGWKYDEESNTLTHETEGYEVDLESASQSSAEALDWIAQVAEKSWATPSILGGLVRAMNRIIHFQASLCGSGVERGPRSKTKS